MSEPAPAPICPRRLASPPRLAPRPEALPLAPLDLPEPPPPSAWAQPLPRVAPAPSPVARALGLARRLPVGQSTALWAVSILILAALGVAVSPAVAAWEGDAPRFKAVVLAIMEP